MGKRSDFKRSPRDFYATPESAVLPLLPFVEGIYFYEPCAGDGALARHLRDHNTFCTGLSDIEPQSFGVMPLDAFDYIADKESTDMIITNPPWDVKILHPMIEHFRKQRPTWLLFYADWMHTKQSIPYMPYCHKIVSVGRVKWIPGSKSVGKDNCAWYLFDKHEAETIFYGRA